MGMQATGVIPLKNKKSSIYPITLESSFTNLSLEFIHRFIPNFYKIKGIATGAINLGGSLDSTIFNYDFFARYTVKDQIWLAFNMPTKDGTDNMNVGAGFSFQVYNGLYFVGAGAHPGAGIPGVLSSAKVLDNLDI